MFKTGDFIKQVTHPGIGFEEFDHGETVLRVVSDKPGVGLTVEYASGPPIRPGVTLRGMTANRYKLVQDATDYTLAQVKQGMVVPDPVPGAFTPYVPFPLPAPAPTTGMKFDKGKLLFSALTRGLALPLRAVVAVLTYGAQKYAEDSWQDVPNGKRRYENALDRHLNAWKAGEEYDQESGLHHLAHVACNVLFVLWFVIKDTADQDDHFTFNDPPEK
jgi:hypothetical protein